MASCWSGPAPTIPRDHWCVKKFRTLPSSYKQTMFPVQRKEGEEKREGFEEERKKKDKNWWWIHWRPLSKGNVSANIFKEHWCHKGWHRWSVMNGKWKGVSGDNTTWNGIVLFHKGVQRLNAFKTEFVFLSATVQEQQIGFTWRFLLISCYKVIYKLFSKLDLTPGRFLLLSCY